MVTTNKQLHMENVTLNQKNLCLSQEKRQLMQDIEKLRQEKAQLNQEKTQLSLENSLKTEELLDYKKQADIMYENERRKSQEVNTQLKSSNQVHL